MLSLRLAQMGIRLSVDISKAPHFDMWHRNYLNVMSQFSTLEDDDKVSYSTDALDGSANLVYYQEILPRSTTVIGTGACELRIVLRNIPSLSHAFDLLGRKVCSQTYMLSLHRKLSQMSLQSVLTENDCSNSESLGILSQ